jgi:hypothetical protein
MWLDFKIANKVRLDEKVELDFIGLPAKAKLNAGYKDSLGVWHVDFSKLDTLKIYLNKITKFTANLMFVRDGKVFLSSFFYNQGQTFFGPCIAVEDVAFSSSCQNAIMRVDNFSEDKVEIILENTPQDIKFSDYKDCGYGVWRCSISGFENKVVQVKSEQKIIENLSMQLQAVDKDFVTKYPFNLYQADTPIMAPVICEGEFDIKELLHGIKGDPLTMSVVNYSQEYMCFSQGLKSKDGNWKIGIRNNALRQKIKVRNHCQTTEIELKIEIEVISERLDFYVIERKLTIPVIKVYDTDKVFPCLACPMSRRCLRGQKVIKLDKRLRFFI